MSRKQPFSNRVKQAAKILLHGQADQTESRALPQITQAEIEQIRQFFPRPKFFIYGHARSGTTLLTRLIRVHPQVHCSYQAHFFTQPPYLHTLVADPKVRAWLENPSNRWNQGGDPSAVMLRAGADFLLEREAMQVGKAIVGDKSPNKFAGAKAIDYTHNLYPDARIIYIVRDGRDVAISRRIQNFIDNDAHLSAADLRIRQALIEHPEEFQQAQASIFTPGGLREAAASWAENVGQTKQRGLALYPERFYVLKYEDLLAMPYAVLRALWEFLGADVSLPRLEEDLLAEFSRNPDAEWQQQKVAAIASVLEKGKRGTWQTMFTPGDKQIFKETAGQQLIEWGYESGLDW